jgi:hypothetical protein
VSTEVDTVSEIPELFLQYFGHQDDERKVYDLNFAQYLKSSKSNVQILKPLLQDIVIDGFGSTPVLLHLVCNQTTSSFMLSSFSERKTRLTVAVRGGLSKKMAFTLFCVNRRPNNRLNRIF